MSWTGGRRQSSALWKSKTCAKDSCWSRTKEKNLDIGRRNKAHLNVGITFWSVPQVELANLLQYWSTGLCVDLIYTSNFPLQCSDHLVYVLPHKMSPRQPASLEKDVPAKSS